MVEPKRLLHFFQGAFAFVGGAMLFALSTVFIKFLTLPPYDLPPLMAAFFRFFIGFVCTFAWAMLHSTDLRPHSPGLVVWRGILNTLAVALFYSAVQFTTVTNTNLLNLMYPAWMLLAGPIITRERAPLSHIVFLVLTLLGAWLITNPAGFMPNGARFNIGDALALASGIIAAFGIAVLRQARKHDGTVVVIFWLFAIGSLVTVVPAILVWKTPPDFKAWGFLLAAGTFGFVGQILLTYGYRWMSAAEGSLLSSSGILFSAIFGVIFFADSLSAPVIIGGILILISIAGVSGILQEIRQKRRALINRFIK